MTGILDSVNQRTQLVGQNLRTLNVSSDGTSALWH